MIQLEKSKYMIRKMIFQNNNSSHHLEDFDTLDTTESFRSFSSGPTVAAMTPLPHNDKDSDDTHLRIHINSQDTLAASYNQLKSVVKSNLKSKSASSVPSSSRTIIKSITMSFRLQDPYKKISQLKKLTKLFATMGSLPHLEELIFVDADLMMTNIYQLFKKSSSSLKVLKFHNCTFVRVKILKLANQIFWRGIQKHTTNLHTLEVLNCSYTASDTLCRERKVFVCDVPTTTCLQQGNNNSLQRLALDECSVDNTLMALLLTKLPALRELEIRPNFDRVTSKHQRRQQYRAKKEAIHTLLTGIIPCYLANNTTLTKLVINLDQHHLENVYLPAMESWVELLVEHNNCTLTDMRITPQSLLELQQQPQTPFDEQDNGDEDDDDYNFCEGCPLSACLLEDLKNMLRLNQLFGGGNSNMDETLFFLQQQQPSPFQQERFDEKDDANTSVMTTTTSDSSIESDESLVGSSSELLDVSTTTSTCDDLSLLPVDSSEVVEEFDV